MSDVTRQLLAQAGTQRLLSQRAINVALDLAGLRPAPDEWRSFAIRAMRFAGVLSFAAGIIFLVAFNWENIGLYARFGMVELPLLGALLFAWSKGLERLSGKLALMLAVLLAGGLLALFGQTYQTGADVYELFLGWAALTLPWVIACRYAPCWALWVVLANAAMLLYAGASTSARLFRWIDSDWSPWTPAFLLDLLLYVTLLLLSRWPELDLGPSWLGRGIMALAMMLGTFAMLYQISGGRSSAEAAGILILLEVLLFLIATAGFFTYAWTQKQDLFNFTVLALSWIVVTTAVIARAMFSNHGDLGSLLLIAIYIIGASTAAVKGIQHLGRQWKEEAK